METHCFEQTAETGIIPSTGHIQNHVLAEHGVVEQSRKEKAGRISSKMPAKNTTYTSRLSYASTELQSSGTSWSKAVQRATSSTANTTIWQNWPGSRYRLSSTTHFSARHSSFSCVCVSKEERQTQTRMGEMLTQGFGCSSWPGTYLGAAPAGPHRVAKYC